jgi:hypothetical protein
MTSVDSPFSKRLTDTLGGKICQFFNGKIKKNEERFKKMSDSKKSFLPGYETLDVFAQELFGRITNVTKMAMKLPREEDFQYQSAFRTYKKDVKDVSQRNLDLIQNVLHYEKGDNSGFQLNAVDDYDQVIDSYDSVTDVVDTLLESVVILKDDKFKT